MTGPKTEHAVRALVSSDIPDAIELSTAAGWNQTASDWQRLIDLQPDGCFGIEQEGRVVATTTVLCHGSEMAWIGMVLTHKDYQRRGLARKLMATALDTAWRQRARCVKLDATDQGEPLYRSLGFRVEQPVERWRREPAPLASDELCGVSTIEYNLDRKAFGSDRRRFLESLSGAGPAIWLDSGYAMTRPGIRARYFGPCVCADPNMAEFLSRNLIGAHTDEPWFWDLLPQNPEAEALAGRLGFRRVRHLNRMSIGDDVRGNDSLVYAIAGFEAG